MSRRIVFSCAVLGLCLALLLGAGDRRAIGLQAGSPVANDAATPVAVGNAVGRIPDTVDIQLLASAEISGLPTGGLELAIDRVELIKGSSFTGEESGHRLFVVETGTILATTGSESIRLEAGGHFTTGPGEAFTITVETDATVLIASAAGSAVEAATPAASPVAEEAPVRLVSGDVNRLVSKRGTLFLLAITMPAGESAGTQLLSGPIVVAVESGEVTLHEDQGADLHLSTGFGGIVQGFTGFNFSNEGDEGATLLVAGILPPVTGAAAGPTPTPTATIDVAATESAQAAIVQATVESLQSAVASAESAAGATIAALTGQIAAAEQAGSAAATVASDEQANSAGTVAAQETAIAAANATIAAQETANAAAAATVVAQETAIAAANATIAGNGATIGDQEAALATAEAKLSANDQTIASVIAANADRASELRAAEATIAAQEAQVNQIQSDNDLLDLSLVAAEATITAQGEAIESAEAAGTSQAVVLSSVVAIVEAQGAAISDANGTVTALNGEVQAAAAEATAQAATIANVEATASAYAAGGAQIAESATAAVGNYQATIGAAQTAAADTQSTLTARSVELQAAEATVIALKTEQANSASLAVASLNPDYVDLSVKVDLYAVLAGDPSALTAAKAALTTAFAPYAGCRAGVVLTFGHGETIGQGTQLAAAVNTVIKAEFPAIFGGAAFDAFGNLNPELGAVDIRIYFFSGCEAAEGN